MGLGADKVALQKKNTDFKKEEEEVKIEKGTFVKIIAGEQSNNYGQIEGFDDDAGRLIIKLALGGNIISVNEFMIQKSMRNIRTRNPRDSSKRWIEKDQCPLTPKTVKNKSSNKRKKIGSTMHNKNKYDKVGDKKSERRKRRSESNDDSDSDSEKKRRRERSNSNSNDSYKLKRLKKSKKRKKYDCSSERSSKKRDDEKDQDLDHLVGSNIFQERIRSFYFQDKLYNFIYTDFIIKCIFTKVYFFSYP
ncbi:G-patch domain and KOW motifs-containing protein-like [Bombus affinis]|uniref:G-patch domain and KOW motifs-containing protein-like n=1 Tax=Bombus affinis TaxID=309941 RepID=UPI0021B814FB|nr:G-patch domain and KOW motifs-containing protein-like [Bombus affinis]XP_050599541.1 G-patch domain and KOW motifs-containing protein-like [Bombus affinis]XP_050599542.1 G-patch domain and KOW motifs-containing protein-like [Bombus affinis]XP_050599543.1 G-patch domain and KOW motifs-containing protein-like [Bombus affinis]XP_050599781.1 G-patch domain and KOW motifs-containing protein-like isoform X1 [Bombus affinis]XP_050599782.1 G-patch domain and KOW motifs-containing protein-like isofo